MASSPASSNASHDSGDEHEHEHGSDNKDGHQGGKGAAVKDKECQYCHQKFTSSSLGRHLDQFISKKKPDGVHDVEEIRKLRGGITRRTARNSSRKELEDGQSQPEEHLPPLPTQVQQQQQLLLQPHTIQPQPPLPARLSVVQPGQHSPSPHYTTLPSYSELVNKTASKEDVRFNRANWQATGVITDTAMTAPASVAAVVAPAIPSPSISAVAGQKRSYSTYAADISTGANSEHVRALELSLREVLDAVRVATRKAAPPVSPFDFDFESQTFQFLCLALLQAPATLFQPTPFATATTIPLNAPGLDQWQTLHKVVTYEIDQWKWKTLSHIQRSSPPGSGIAEDIDDLNERAQTMTTAYLSHLGTAYQHFLSYPIETRSQLWTIELLRGYKSEKEKTKEAKVSVDRAAQEIVQLQQQLDHLSRCQWPREMALWPPERPSFDTGTQDELRKLNLLRGVTSSSSPSSTPPNHMGNANGSANLYDAEDSTKSLNDRWDYDRLLSKWRRHVREDRARRTGVPPASGGPDASMMQSPKSVPSTTPRASMAMNYGHSSVGIASNLHKSTTLSPDLPPPRPLSASASYQLGSTAIGGAVSTPSVGDSPYSNANNTTSHHIAAVTDSGNPTNSAATSSPGSASISVAPSATGGGASYVPPPPPRSRPMGIVSDADEYYGPRLMGFRRDPPVR